MAQARASQAEADVNILISKITVKTLKCDPKEAIKQGKAVPLCRIWGIASTVKYVVNRTTGNTDTALVGDFKGMNLEDGEVKRSGVLYLPAGVQDQIAAPLIKAKDAGNDTVNIRFALEVSAFPSSVPAGYSYSAKILNKPEGMDPLAELENAVGKGLLALPSPKA